MNSKARNINLSPVHPNTNICSYRNKEYSDYIYLSIEKLQSINNANMADAKISSASYLDCDRYAYYYPDPSYTYLKLLEEINAINEIILYKIICRERLFSSSCIKWNHKEYVCKSIDKITDAINCNPYISYFELLDLFPNDEIELVLESLIEDNRLQCTKISKGIKKGKNIITVK